MDANGPNFTVESHEVGPIKAEDLQESGIGELEDGLPFKGRGQARTQVDPLYFKRVEFFGVPQHDKTAKVLPREQ
nr:hypothetical protein [Candidatus Tectomicrobia bacterium]